MSPSAHHAGGRRSSPHTRDTIIAALRRWNELFGEPPCTADWNPSVARWRAQEWRIERYVAGDPETGAPWPSLNAAKRCFDGSFDAAVRAAGLPPRKPGPRRAARTAVPDLPQREPVDARVVALEAEVVALREQLRAATEAEAAAERMAVRERRRADRAEERIVEVRVRARRAGDRARRARMARERASEEVAVLRGDVVAGARARVAQLAERLREAEDAAADAEARARAADDRAEAAWRDAAAAGVATLGEPAVDDGGGGPVGPAVMADALRGLARARASGDRHRLAAALTVVATSALRWRDRL